MFELERKSWGSTLTPQTRLLFGIRSIGRLVKTGGVLKDARMSFSQSCLVPDSLRKAPSVLAALISLRADVTALSRAGFGAIFFSRSAEQAGLSNGNPQRRIIIRPPPF